MNIYLFSHYNVNGLGISQRYWKISSSSFEVEAKPPPPSASPPEIGGASTSQDLEEIFQYLLEIPRPLSQYPVSEKKGIDQYPVFTEGIGKCTDTWILMFYFLI